MERDSGKAAEDGDFTRAVHPGRWAGKRKEIAMNKTVESHTRGSCGLVLFAKLTPGGSAACKAIFCHQKVLMSLWRNDHDC